MRLAIDSTMFYRNFANPFFAQLGVGLRIEDEKAFESSYLATMEALKKRYSLSTNRLMLTSRSLTESLENDEAKKATFLNDFFVSMYPLIEKAFLVYTIIPQTKIPAVNCYEGKVSMKPVEFIKTMTQPYTHCILWKLINDGYHDPTDHSLVDSFGGDETRAWEKLKQLSPKVDVYYHGDDCNPLISAADLFCKHIDYELERKRLRLGTPDLYTCFADSKVNVEPVFLDDLAAIVPRVKRQMDTSDFTRRPIVMVFGSSTVKDERSVINAVGLFDKLANFAYNNSACLKFFDYDDPSSDARLLAKGSDDFFVAIGERGMTTAKYFVEDLGVQGKILKPSDIK